MRPILFFLLMLFGLPSLAQLSGNGYYRVRNSVNEDNYIALVNNILSFDNLVSAAGGGTALALNRNNARDYAMKCAKLYLQTDIHLVEDANLDKPETIIYINKKSSYLYNLTGQSVSLIDLTTGQTTNTSIPIEFSGIPAELKPVNDKYTAAVDLKAKAMGLTQSLGNHYFFDNNGKFDLDKSLNDNSYWYITPVTSLHVSPTVEHRGMFYATMYLPFAYKLSGDVESAYVIKSINEDGTLEKYCIATKENGKAVPAGTPVILECKSNVTENCDLIPQGEPRTDAESSYTETTNLLKGTYFCNTDGVQTYEKQGGSTGTFNANNYTARVDAQMRVLNEVDGKLGFFLASNDKMKANKAWLDASSYQGGANADFTFNSDELEKGGNDE